MKTNDPSSSLDLTRRAGFGFRQSLGVFEMSLLLVEGDHQLATRLARRLRAGGFEVDTVATGSAAVRRLAIGDVRLVVLDLKLPDMDGLQVIDFGRFHQLMTPILVMTGTNRRESGVEALQHGADDFVVKRCEPAEFLARVRALARRAAAPRWAPLECNGLVCSGDTLIVRQGVNRISLSNREHQVLALLLRRQNEVVSRNELRALVLRDPEFMRASTVLNVYIGNLRRKLGSQFVVIEPVRSIGYRLRPAK